MTVIVAMISRDKVHIGADSRYNESGGYYEDYNRTNSKFLDIHDNIIAAAAGSVRVGQIIEEVADKMPDIWNNSEGSFEFSKRNVIRFANACASRMNHYRVGDPEKNELPEADFTLVIGAEGKAYTICEDWSVLEVEGCTQIGSGGDVAMGALMMLIKHKPKWGCDKMIEEAIGAAIKKYNNCGYPIEIRRI